MTDDLKNPPPARRDDRTAAFASQRRRWPGLLFLAILVAGGLALGLSTYYGHGSTGAKAEAGAPQQGAAAHAAAKGVVRPGE